MWSTIQMYPVSLGNRATLNLIHVIDMNKKSATFRFLHAIREKFNTSVGSMSRMNLEASACRRCGLLA